MICSWNSHPWLIKGLGEQFLREGEIKKKRAQRKERENKRERVRKRDTREDLIERERE
jgi:hypothetical protein